jgi:hypothetical protein
MRQRGFRNWCDFILFICKWKIILRGVNDVINIRELENWGGQVNTKGKTTIKTNNRYPCPALWDIVMINHEGDIFPCCEQLSHVDGSLKLGNINEISLTEAFKSEKYRRIREDHLRGNWDFYPECVNCDFWASSPERKFDHGS